MTTTAQRPDAPMFMGQPPTWALRRPKPIWQSHYDFIGAPLRMMLLPDHRSEQLHLTSLRAERLAAVLPLLEGRCLDVGAGDNMLMKLYRHHAVGTPHELAAENSIGVDVFDWGGDCLIVDNCRQLPFADNTFDTVCFVACLNHIPERIDALREAHRILKPGGKMVATMIGNIVGTVGHALWWYSEDKHRKAQRGELMGMDPRDVRSLITAAGFDGIFERRFVYGMNHLYIAERC